MNLRTLAAAILGALAIASSGAASAQTGWTHEGIAFSPREGWCTSVEDQGGSAALTASPCGQEFPIFSVGIAVKDASPINVATLNAQSVEMLSKPDGTGKAIVDGIMTKKDPGCALKTFTIDPNPAPPIQAYAVVANYTCPTSTADVPFKNLTAYAQTKSGNVWVVAFDYPLAPITEADRKMLQSALATINASN